MIPNYQVLMMDILRNQQINNSIDTHVNKNYDCLNYIITKHSLTACDVTEKYIKSGENILKVRVRWALAHLKKLKFIISTGKGQYMLTPLGRYISNVNTGNTIIRKVTLVFPEMFKFVYGRAN